jgi:hypothetical protein
MQGVSHAKFWLDYDPLVDVHRFEPSPGVVNSGALVWELDLALPGCPPGSFLAGHFVVQGHVDQFRLCLGAPPDNIAYGCAFPNDPGPNALMGYAAGFSKPCVTDFAFFDGNCIPTVSIESLSWGELKARFGGTEAE